MKHVRRQRHMGSFGDAYSASQVPITESALNLSDPDTARGFTIISQFYDHASRYSGWKLNGPIDILNFYMTTWKGPIDPNAFLASIGAAASTTGMSDSSTDSAMTALAVSGQGKIPANPNGFFNALSNVATTPTWTDAAYAVVQTVEQVGVGLNKVGETLVDTGQIALQTINFSKYLIYLLPLAAAWWVVTNRNQLSKAAVDVVEAKIRG